MSIAKPIRTNLTKVLFLNDQKLSYFGGGATHIKQLEMYLHLNYQCDCNILTPSHTNFFLRCLWAVFPLNGFMYCIVNRPTLIHSHGYQSALAGKILSLLFNIPQVHTVHGSCNLDLRLNKFLTLIEKWILTKIKYSAQITVSRVFLKYKNCNHPIYIPNSINTKPYDEINQKKSPNPTIIWVGRPDLVKDFSTFKSSINILKSRFPNLNTIISDQGQYSGKSLIQAYKKSHLYVQTSLAEGFPYTLLEAWAAKIPVITTSVGENQFIVNNGVNGYLVSPSNPQLLATKISKVLSNKKKLILMGNNGYRLVKKLYSEEKIIPQIVGVYQSVLKSNQQLNQRYDNK